jgi:hypothetical protein
MLRILKNLDLPPRRVNLESKRLKNGRGGCIVSGFCFILKRNIFATVVDVVVVVRSVRNVVRQEAKAHTNGWRRS